MGCYHAMQSHLTTFIFNPLYFIINKKEACTMKVYHNIVACWQACASPHWVIIDSDNAMAFVWWQDTVRTFVDFLFSLDEAQCTTSPYSTNKKVPLEKLFGTFVQFCTTGHSIDIFVHVHNTALWSYKRGRVTHICVTKLDYHQVIIVWDMSHHSISMEFVDILMVTYKSYMFVWSTSLNSACLVIYCEQSFA